MSQSDDPNVNLDLDDVDLDIEVDENVDAGVVEPTQEKPKKQRASRKRSKVWDHYNSFINEKGEQKSACRYCGREYFSSTKTHGTSTLLGHLRNCASYPQNKESGQTHLMIQTDEKKVNLLAWKFDQLATRKALAYMVIVDELPFKLVEGKGFRHFLSVCQPLFQIPSRFTVARDIKSFYLEEKKKVRAFLKENVGRICLTTDTWTSLQKVNYMCVTAHFVDNDWNLQKRILSFKPISSHRGVDIGKSLELCLIEWGIEWGIDNLQKRILDAFRSSLTPKVVQALICCQDWLRVNSSPIDIEEACDDLLQLEEEYDDGAIGSKTC